MQEEKKGLGNGCAIAVIIGLIIISWGIPEIFRGNGAKGFMEGIGGNFQALFILAIIALVGYVIYKVFLKDK